MFPCLAAGAQPMSVADNALHAAADLPEFQKIISETYFDEPSRLDEVEDGLLFSDVGFEQYRHRMYSFGEFGNISIAIVTLMDFRAAYSVLTLKSSEGIQDGPPGDAFAVNAQSVSFIHGRFWVRIVGRRAPPDLMKRLAMAVSSRLGPPGQKPPALVDRFPKTGFIASTLKYFPGLKSFESYSGSAAFRALHLNFDAEIAQAMYALNSQNATLTLLNFPTPEIGEVYFNEFSANPANGKKTDRIYVKRAGPVVALLTGQLDPAAADKILGSVHHSYAIRWIFEKPKKSVAWGVPVRILHTVVNSILFVVLLALIAVFAGASIAWWRFSKNRRLSKNRPDGIKPTDSTHLRLR